MYKVENPAPELNYCDYIHNVTTINETESHIKFFNSSTEKTYNLKVSSNRVSFNGDFLYLNFELKGKPVDVFATQIKPDYTECPKKFKDMWEGLFVEEKQYKEARYGD